MPIAKPGKFPPRLTARLKGLITAFLLPFLLTLPPAAAQVPVQQIRQPNGEYTEATDDLVIKVLGGAVRVTRSWSHNRWYLNPAWANLKFNLDPLDDSVKVIDRAGSLYERGGNDSYHFDKTSHLQRTQSGWRWTNLAGDWIDYDTAGRLTAYGNPQGNTVRFILDADGTRREIRDHHNRLVLRFSYNADDRLSQITDRAGRSVSYTWQGPRLTQVTDARGQTWQYAYDANGQLIERQDPYCNAPALPASPPCGKIRLTYAESTPAPDSAMDSGKQATQTNTRRSALVSTGQLPADVKLARVATLTDEGGNTTVWNTRYDRLTREYSVSEQAPDGRLTVTRYDRQGQLLSQSLNGTLLRRIVRDTTWHDKSTDARGFVTHTDYNENRQVIRILHPDGSQESNRYNARGQKTQHTDENGTVTTWDYDSSGQLIRRSEAFGTPVERLTSWTYDADGQATRQTLAYKDAPEAERQTQSRAYDADGNLVQRTDGSGAVTVYTHHVTGQIDSRTDPLGRKSEYRYNAAGQLETAIAPDGARTRFTRDAYGRVVSQTDPLGNTRKNQYDAAGRLIEQTDPLGQITVNTYDSAGRPTTIQTPGGLTTRHSYDSEGRLVEQTDPAGNKTRYEYGTAQNGLQGLLAASESPAGRSEYRYDSRGRLNEIHQILGADQRRITRQSYDATGQRLSQTDPAGNSTLTEVDPLGRIVKITDAYAAQTRQTWDASDNLVSLTDAKGNTHRFQYDKTNRLTQETRPLGGATRHTWDAAGQLTQSTDANGHTRRYQYDLAGRRIQETITAAGQAAPEQSITSTYDAAGRLTAIEQTDSLGQRISRTGFTLDALGRNTEESLAYGPGAHPDPARQAAFTPIERSLKQSWNSDAQKTAFTHPDGSRTGYTYSNGQRQQATLPNGQTLTWKDWQGSQATQIETPGATTSLSLDPLARPVRIRVTPKTQNVPNPPPALDRQYRYDLAGNITEIQGEEGTTAYAYDRLNRLTQVKPDPALQALGLPEEGYAYDAVHNRTTSAHQPGAWQYNADNQLTQWGINHEQVTLTYTASGQTKTERKNGQTRTYHYNAADRLVGIDENGTPLAQYRYDPQGRRIAKTVITNGSSKTTFTLYSEEGLIAELDETGRMTKAYGWMPGTMWGTAPLWQAEPGTGKTLADAETAYHYLHTDHLGTPVLATDAAGQKTWRGRAEAFGKTVAAAGSTVTVGLRFPGQVWDAESGLHQNFFRDYEARTGRYVESDPIGLGAGANAYVYANNAPLLMTDAFGLQSTESTGDPLVACRLIGRRPQPDRCLTEEQCYETVRNALLRCSSNIWNTGRKVACVTCWRHVLAGCPGLTPGPECAPQACSLKSSGFA